MPDETEAIRRGLLAAINDEPQDRTALEQFYGKVWTLAELGEEFVIKQFAAPLIVVKRLSDGVLGTMYFQHSPRFYFNFKEDTK
jgi:hypothetical protein